MTVPQIYIEQEEITKTHLVELPVYKNCSQASQRTLKNQVKDLVIHNCDPSI